jgi:hypothetical protein
MNGSARKFFASLISAKSDIAVFGAQKVLVIER